MPLAVALHDWLASKVHTSPVSMNTQVLVRLSVPDDDLVAALTLEKCSSHGLAEVAVHVTGWLSTVPTGMILQAPALSPNEILVSRICVCVTST
jgi:hypothetical protein